MLCADVSSGVHRSLLAHQSVVLGEWKNSSWNLSCWAGGISVVNGEGSFFDGEEENLLSSSNASEAASVAPFGTLDAEITPETIDFFVIFLPNTYLASNK